MKPLFTFLLAITFANSYGQEFLGEDLNKLTVSKNDSSLWLVAHMRLDHRIFGYAKPDTNSQKLILISIFTDDVENNPHKCTYGSYYQISRKGSMKLKFLKKEKHFIKAAILENDTSKSFVYFLREWVTFEK